MHNRLLRRGGSRTFLTIAARQQVADQPAAEYIRSSAALCQVWWSALARPQYRYLGRRRGDWESNSKEHSWSASRMSRSEEKKNTRQRAFGRAAWAARGQRLVDIARRQAVSQRYGDSFRKCTARQLQGRIMRLCRLHQSGSPIQLSVQDTDRSACSAAPYAYDRGTSSEYSDPSRASSD